MSEGPGAIPMGLALERLIAGIDLDFSLAAPEVPHAVRNRLRAALESSDLLLDSAQRGLSQLADEPDAGFVYFDPQGRYTMQVFCWPPGFGNDPHLHTNWNVSGIMAGSLLLFRSAISEADCIASQPLVADTGQAGVLIPPQFHCLRNDGSEPAITFHIFSLDQAGETNHLERPPASQERIDDDGILALATAAATHAGARSVDIIQRAFLAAGIAAKLKLIKLMVKVDPREAARMGRHLSQLVGGQDGRRLLAAVEKLEVAAGQGH
jgi:predicted metal-dependent enzyme (double-stranded beta helix superfamily)